MTKKTVAKLVLEQLQKHRPGGVDFRVLEEEIRLRDDCWDGPVQPRTEPRSTFMYYEALADVEEELCAKAHLKVWLVPAISEEDLQSATLGPDRTAPAARPGEATPSKRSLKSKKAIARLIRERLRDVHPGGAILSVVDEKMYQQNGCWRIPIRPDKEPPRAFEYYDALAEVEAQLSEQANLNVWLVPTDPEEAPSRDGPAQEASRA